mmetsp:Transcript_11750/g.21152  ORF Transcript_11750/g.21152 Transcript_11750/m.21152 type:complete len:285 (-) Transcript_11750:682-1536(-)
MNTASRMESTGLANHIQISQDTANLLASADKSHWFKERESKVTAKGKGELTTYFLTMDQFTYDASNNKNLTEMAKVRKARKIAPDSRALIESLEQQTKRQGSDEGNQVINEVAEYIILPDYTSSKDDGENVSLDDTIVRELQNYVQTIASLYNENPFHNFSHASHVVMSVNKLLSRIVAPDLDDADDDGKKLHDHTYGITSDPLTRFAVVFAALIHDVDHSGVPNAQLVKEKAPVAALYHDKSVAEQNSFDLAWDLLMEPAYKNLRRGEMVEPFRKYAELVVSF